LRLLNVAVKERFELKNSCKLQYSNHNNMPLAALGEKRSAMAVSFRPILLKKSDLQIG